MKELQEKNINFNEKSYKIKVDFLFPYEGYNDETLVQKTKRKMLNHAF